LSNRMNSYVQDEIKQLSHSKTFLDGKAVAFADSEREVNEQTGLARDEMNKVLEEIRVLRGDVKDKVGEGLNGLSAAAQRISAGVISEFETFHTQVCLLPCLHHLFLLTSTSSTHHMSPLAETSRPPSMTCRNDSVSSAVKPRPFELNSATLA
jgi:hypothetical protein